MNVLAFAASPRHGGNSETLLDHALGPVRDADIRVEKVWTHDLAIEPCTGCGACSTTGRCIIEDAFQDVAGKLIACDGIIFATPLYFMHVPARAKALIDRCQSFWAARELCGIDLFGNRRRSGLLIGCAAKRFGPGGTPIFRGLEDTFYYVFRSLSVTPVEPMFVSGVEHTEDVIHRSDLCGQAAESGSRFVQALREGILND